MEENPLASGRSGRRLPPGSRTAPWLVFPNGKGGKHQQAFYNICEPNNKTCRKFIPELSRKSYWQKHSHQGWLVILCDDIKAEYSTLSNYKFGDCFMWNPVTLDTIQLPSLLGWFNKTEYWIQDCLLSSPPKSTNHGSMVFFLFGRLVDEVLEQVLVYCRATGEDKEWRTKELSGYILDDMAPNDVKSLFSFKGKIYGLCSNFWHLEIEIKIGHDADSDADDETLSIRSFNVSNDTFSSRIGGQYARCRRRYIESFDELFMIDMCYYPRGPVVLSIEVLRLDFTLMEWEKVKSLGDHVLFLGENTRTACSAAELGLTRGCLYYILPRDQSLYKYEVEDNCITPILPCFKLPTPWSSADWVMMPTSVSVADGRRRRRRTKDVLSKEEEEDTVIQVEEKKASTNNDEKVKHWQKENEGELEVASPWGILTEDIVELIASYLHPVDYGCFRAASRENRRMIPAQYRRSSLTGSITNIHLSPLLVYSKDNDTIYSFIDPMHNNKKYLMNLSALLVGATIHFSKGGWLLMSKGRRTIFFYNPFTKAMIQLPDLSETRCFIGMSFLSLPTSSDCVVFGIAHENYDEISLYVIRRGNNFWSSEVFENFDLERYMPRINNPVFYDEAFYCLDHNGTLGVFSLDRFSWKVLTHPRGQFNPLYPSFLVECDGKLILVDLGPFGKSIGVFRLDFSKMAWVKVESLGKHMLFISNTTCLSAIAPDIHMENKIYFPRLHRKRILFYSLDTCKYHSFGSQHSATDFYDTTEWLNCTWIEPNWSSTTERELDWLSI